MAFFPCNSKPFKMPLFRVNINYNGTVGQTYAAQMDNGNIWYATGAVGSWMTFPDSCVQVKVIYVGPYTSSYEKHYYIREEGNYYINGGWYYMTPGERITSYGSLIAYYDTLENPFEK